VSAVDVDALHASPLAARHAALGATMTDFAGWSMPVRYSSDIGEHRAVRTAAGLFDVSHMGEIWLRGPGAAAALDAALVSWISRVAVGRAKYTMICAPDGGVIDDLIVYRTGEETFLVVANAGNASVVAAELSARCAGDACVMEDRSEATSLIALQGPASRGIVDAMTGGLPADLKYYAATQATVAGSIPALVGRTGYTGEDGYEFFVATDDAGRLWDAALASGAGDGLVPCGLAARDTLRLEAGMPLYGHELGLGYTPYAAGLGRVVQFGTPDDPRGDFVGRDALEFAARNAALWDAEPRLAPSEARVLVGLSGDGKRAARAGYRVLDGFGAEAGEVTSGAPSPTLERPIAMAYVYPRFSAVGTRVIVDVRGRGEQMRVTALPFYQRPVAATRGA
jgi:aminomethyltransferase